MSKDVKKPSREDWGWWAGEDDERCTVGPCASREAVIAAAVKEGLGLPYSGKAVAGEPQAFHILEGIQAPIDLAHMFCADEAVGAMCERIHENHGDPDGDALTDRAWTPEQQKDLEGRLTKTVRAWQADHRIVVLPYLFTETRNAERVEIPAPPPSPSPVPSSALPQVVSPSA